MKVIGLFGRMKFQEHFLELEQTLSFKGYLVLMPYIHGMFEKESYSSEQWEYLMNHCLKRIDLVDIVYIVDVGGSIGEHTQKEIDYALDQKKEIWFYSKIAGFEPAIPIGESGDKIIWKGRIRQIVKLYPSDHKWLNCFYCWSLAQDFCYCDYTSQKYVMLNGEFIDKIPEPKNHVCEKWKLRGRGTLPDIPFKPICKECKESKWLVKLDRRKVSLECECGNEEKIDIHNWR